MYYSMNGTGSILDSVLIDSQNPTAGTYDPATHQPTTTQPRLLDQIFNTANKAIDAFNPQIKQAAVTPTPTTQPTWVKPVLITGVVVLAGYGVYRYMKSRKK